MDDYIWLKDGDFFEKNDELHDSKTDAWDVIPDRLIGRAYPSIQQGRRKIHKQKMVECVSEEIPKEVTQRKSWLNNLFRKK